MALESKLPIYKCSFDVPVNVTHLPKDSKMKKLMCYGSIGAYDPGTKMWEKLEGKWEIGTRFVLIKCFLGFICLSGTIAS